MQYTVLSDSFGGLNTYMDPDKVGPNAATVSNGVDISSGILRNRLADQLPTLSSGIWNTTDTYVPADSKTIVPWKSGALGMSERYAAVRWGDQIYRSHKGVGSYPSYLNGIQYTKNTTTPPEWNFLGIMSPGTPTFSVASTTGTTVPAGTYTYYCTFSDSTNTYESAPAIATVTLSSTGAVTVTLPQAYTTCNTSNGSATITNIADVSKIRPGMRINGTGIPTSTVVSVNTSASTAVLSNTCTANGTAVQIIDPQVSRVRTYRSSDVSPTPRLTDSRALGTASFTDSKKDSQLTDVLPTADNADMPVNLRDVTISPSGIVMCAGDNSTVVWFSLRSKGLYNPAQVIPVSDPPLAIIYALDRFICPTIRGAFTVTIDDAFVGIPVVQVIDDNEPCENSAEVYMTDIGGTVWWNTSKGIVQTDGNTIETVTKYTFANTTTSYFSDCFGAAFWNDDYYSILRTGSNTAALYKYSRQNGWSVVNPSMSYSTGAIGFHVSSAKLIYTGCTLDSPVAVRKLYGLTTKNANGVYATGNWTGEKTMSLKKFRKVSLLHSGTITIQPYIDNVATAYTFTANSSTQSFNRSSFWLPSGTKGRKMSFQFTLVDANSEVEEIGLWVGEQREPSP